MDAVSAAASLLALAELAAKVSVSCNNFYRAVKNASKDIARLDARIQNLQQILAKAGELYEGFPDGHQTIAANMPSYLKSCDIQLTELCDKLQSPSRSSLSVRLKLEKFAWPFKEKQVNRLIEDLTTIQQDIVLAMQIDQSAILKGLQSTQDHLLLPVAEGASFDSFSDQLNARCYEGTRVEIRQQIKAWFLDSDGCGIFWLNGMAGTGKSTILRSIAQDFSDCRRLGASFFFKRGEGDRGDASRFFTTIVRQMIENIPRLGMYIREACKLSPQIHSKTMAEQVQKLILQPMEQYINEQHEPSINEQQEPFIIVVDALDECDDSENARSIIQLLSQIESSSSGMVRLLLSSRPESPIRSAFTKLPSSTYTSFALQDILEAVIRHDLEIYIRHELLTICDDHKDDISADWPVEEQIERLIDVVHPLFIAAATACRFIGDPRWDPEQQLEIILSNDNTSQSHQMARVYQPILNQMLVNLDHKQKIAILDEFQLVIGSIIVLEDALSVNALAALLGIPKRIIKTRLATLHSVIKVPTDDNQAVKLLHLSFRNFLAAADTKNNPFAIDENTIHQKISTACIRLLSSTACLKQDICNFGDPAIHRDHLDNNVVLARLPPEIRYACSYWSHHITSDHGFIADDHPVYDFLKTKFLYWLEALVLLGRHFDAKTILIHVQDLCSEEGSSGLSQFLHDAIIFTQNTQSMLDMYPLQLYSSGLIFTPKQNDIRTLYESCIPAAIEELPVAQDLYYDSFKSFAYHTGNVHYMTLSPDGKQFATCSSDGLIKLWETATGRLQHILYGRSHWITKAQFVLEGKRLISFSGEDGQIFLWDTEKGFLERTFNSKFSDRRDSSTSHDGQLLAIWTPRQLSTLELLILKSGLKRQLDHGQMHGWANVQFSQDDTRLAAFKDNQIVTVLDISTGNEIFAHKIPILPESLLTLSFSESGFLLAYSDNEKINIWSINESELTLRLPQDQVLDLTFFSNGSRLLCTLRHTTEVQVWNLESHSLDPAYQGCERPVAFSNNRDFLFTGLKDDKVGVWNGRTHKIEQTIEANVNPGDTILVSPDICRMLLRTSKSIHLWDLISAQSLYSIRRAKTEIFSLHLSPDSSHLASSLSDGTVLVWNVYEGAIIHQLSGQSFQKFSSAGSYWAIDAKERIDVWDTKTRTVCLTVPYTSYMKFLMFSPDESLLMTKENDNNMLLWSTTTGERVQTFQDDPYPEPTSAAFSSNSKRSVTLYLDGMKTPWERMIRIWSHETGSLTRTLAGPSHTIFSGIHISEDHLLIFWVGCLHLLIFSTGTEAGPDDICCNFQLHNADLSDIDGELSLKLTSTGAEMYDTSSRTLVAYEKLPTNRLIPLSHLLFSADLNYREFDQKMVSLMDGDGDTLVLSRRRNHVYYTRDWLVVDEKRTLWIPTQYRPTTWAMRQRKIARAFMRGEILIYDHDTSGRKYLRLPADR